MKSRGPCCRSGSVTITLLLAIVAVSTVFFRWELPAAPATMTRFAGPTSSQPLALTGDGSFLAAVNPDSNTVSFFDLRDDRNRKLMEIAVQTEPNGVAIMPDGSRTFVANTVSGTISILKASLPNGVISKNAQVVKVGTEPYSVVLTPNGKYLYVANARSNNISVIDTVACSVVKTIPLTVPEPRGLAISNDGDEDDRDETLYVTHFLSLPIEKRNGGSGDAKEAFVSVISTATNSVTNLTKIHAISDSGFPAPPARFATGAYPNQLQNIAIKGGYAFLPNTCASPDGPVRFDMNTHSCLSVLNRATNEDAHRTINMHRVVASQRNPSRLFVANPWAIATKYGANEAYVASAGSNILVKLSLNPETGEAAVLSDPLDPAKVLQISTGRNPRGIVVNPTDSRAYVMNYVSRDISVIKLDSRRESVLTTIQSTALPAPGSDDEKIHAGKELYFTSVGVFDPAPGRTLPVSGRMSNNGWSSCGTCHPFGLSDNVTWILPSGPKRPLPQNTGSVGSDLPEAFEMHLRKMSGGQGAIVREDGLTPEDQALATGRQLKMRGFDAWDAIQAYQQSGIRTPISPVPDTDPDVLDGRALFISANCQSCHGTARWTTGRAKFPTGGSDGRVPPSLLGLFAYPGVFFHGGAAASLDQVMENVAHRAAGTGGVDTLSFAADRSKIVKFVLSIDAATVPIASGHLP
jgi:YVTN family beta-propeller protein